MTNIHRKPQDSIANLSPTKRTQEVAASDLDELLAAVHHIQFMLSELHGFTRAMNPGYVDSTTYLQYKAVLGEADKYCR